MSIRKKQLFWSFLFLALIAGTLVFVGKASAESLGFSIEEKRSNEPPGLTVEVRDEYTQEVVSDAIITVSNQIGGSSFIARDRTSDLGKVSFPISKQDYKSITVEKKGYTSLSLVGAKANRVTVFLKVVRESADDVIANGTLEGWKSDLRGDNSVYAGLVFKSMNISDLMYFDPDSFVSPLRDEIDFLGPRKIPSNLVLPEQYVYLPFGGIGLNKPDYRLPVRPNYKTRLTGVHGEIAVADILSAIGSGGRVSIDLLNKLKFNKVGITDWILPESNFQKDVTANISLRIKHEVRVNKPPFTADVLVASATDLNGDREVIIPTDIKTAINSDYPSTIRTVRLSAPTEQFGHSQGIFSLAFSKKNWKISAIISNQAGRRVRPGEFLNVPTLGRISSLPETVPLAAPETGVGTLIFNKTISDEIVTFSAQKSQPVWVVHVLPAAGTVDVPTSLVSQEDDIEGYTLIHLDFGGQFDEQRIDGRQIMIELSRFARATAKVSAMIKK